MTSRLSTDRYTIVETKECRGALRLLHDLQRSAIAPIRTGRLTQDEAFIKRHIVGSQRLLISRITHHRYAIAG